MVENFYFCYPPYSYKSECIELFIRLGVFGLSELISLRLDISTVDWTPRLNSALDVSYRWCIRHLISAVHWTSRLDGALHVSDIAWTLSKEPKESYKYDFANSLVPLIALSYNHQNHK